MVAVEAKNGAARLLLVDDEPHVADLLALALSHAGHQVKAARSGEEALTAAAESRPRLILLDALLPGIDGLEVARRIRTRETGTAILFLSARDSAEAKARAVKAGGDGYLTKPFSIERLLRRVETLIGGSPECTGREIASLPKPIHL